jgi:phosphoserine phosphatase RsbU/P
MHLPSTPTHESGQPQTLPPAKILVVDDEPDVELLIRQMFRKRIQRSELQFVFAGSGVQALAALGRDRDIDIMLTDINMPEMDGLTLLARIPEADVNPMLKSIVVSAYGDLDNIRTAMNRGAFDFVTKPIDAADLEITLNKTITELEIIRQSARAREQLLALQQELGVARRIQQSILPPPLDGVAAIDLHGGMIAARDVGGDFFDYFRIGHDRLGIVVADVSGKGVPAAIYMAMSRTLLRSTALAGGSPADVLSRVNDTLAAESDAGMFVTTFYGVLDLATGALTYCNGGHNPPFILRTDGSVELLATTPDLIVGVMRGYPYNEHVLQLAPGEGLVLYTDGVTEAMNSSEDMYEEASLERLLRTQTGATAAQIVEAVVADVRTFAAGHPQSDDLTSLVVRYTGA